MCNITLPAFMKANINTFPRYLIKASDHFLYTKKKHWSSCKNLRLDFLSGLRKYVLRGSQHSRGTDFYICHLKIGVPHKRHPQKQKKKTEINREIERGGNMMGGVKYLLDNDGGGWSSLAMEIRTYAFLVTKIS